MNSYFGTHHLVCKGEARRGVDMVFLTMQKLVSFSSQLKRFDLGFIAASENHTFGELNPSADDLTQNRPRSAPAKLNELLKTVIHDALMFGVWPRHCLQEIWLKLQKVRQKALIVASWRRNLHPSEL